MPSLRPHGAATRRSCFLVLIALGLSRGLVVAQQAPGSLGLGTKRGIQMMNQSGQVGTVTLFSLGSGTLVDVEMHGVPPGRIERVAIHRNADCERPIDPSPAYPLHDLVDARSRTLVAVRVAKLLSGNYSVVVSSGENAHHRLACGHLFH